ncbi:hypothetical protein PV08_01696 [Exophiala spinifera]|uniref:FMN hydroxy acid dehydrogenase domain-containing protein n=1 Tax=Exophiala spinifera TaxID=91928 RepID=A0A0D1Z0I7_9EURO|nr:uncharacterized protein PV08_01696 [Exophiala spinifera]KIW21116.1 hypothetical protein PV08_01696 [Exophiala spinifera]
MSPKDKSEGLSSSSHANQRTPHDLNCLTIAELEALAHERMDKQTRDYYNEGADAGTTLSENISAYSKYRIRPRVLRDISQIDTTVDVFGHTNSAPFGVAPTAMQRLAHSDGELATARACKSKGIVMGLSSFSTSTLEDVAEASEDNPNVLQLYLFEERAHSIRLIDRAKKAGYKAVLLTVDTPMLGRRNLEIRNQFKLPAHLSIANFAEQDSDEDDAASGSTSSAPTTTDASSASSSLSTDNTNAPNNKTITNDHSSRSTRSSSTRPNQPNQHANTSSKRDAKSKSASSTPKPKPAPKPRQSVAGYHDGHRRRPPTGPITFHTHAANPTLSWEEAIPWLKSRVGPMQVWVKGVATAEDAILAVHHGVDGIVVSNHGGRQLNGALATLDALPEVAAAVNGKVPVHVDGGIRHGTDVFKALALGADFCWIGRPVLWGLAYKGQEGVELCLRLLMDEFRLCMGLAGVTAVKDITREYLCRVDRDGFVSKL